MKVEDVIKHLEKCDPKMDVFLNHGCIDSNFADTLCEFVEPCTLIINEQKQEVVLIS